MESAEKAKEKKPYVDEFFGAQPAEKKKEEKEEKPKEQKPAGKKEEKPYVDEYFGPQPSGEITKKEPEPKMKVEETSEQVKKSDRNTEVIIPKKKKE